MLEFAKTAHRYVSSYGHLVRALRPLLSPIVEHREMSMVDKTCRRLSTLFTARTFILFQSGVYLWDLLGCVTQAQLRAPNVGALSSLPPPVPAPFLPRHRKEEGGGRGGGKRSGDGKRLWHRRRKRKRPALLTTMYTKSI